MLKELNSVAHGLLGLHGYPTQPFGWGRDVARSGRDEKAIVRPERAAGVRKSTQRSPAVQPRGTCVAGS